MHSVTETHEGDPDVERRVEAIWLHTIYDDFRKIAQGSDILMLAKAALQKLFFVLMGRTELQK